MTGREQMPEGLQEGVWGTGRSRWTRQALRIRPEEVWG